jgi:RNA polymerase sigma-70 factor, ECF subfamily
MRGVGDKLNEDFRENHRPRKRRHKVAKNPEDETLSEKEIVSRVLAGETALFEKLVHPHSQRVYRAARAILRDDSEAADVVQESFLRAYRNLKQFAGRARFSTWLTKIALHEARARSRRIRARGEGLPSPARNGARDEPATGPDPEKRVMVQEAKTILEAAIDALPDLYRAVFVMRVLEEMSTAETAECLNLTEDAVKTRLLRARALLRKKVGPMRGEPFRFAGRRCVRMWEERILPAITAAGRREARPG